MRDFDLQINLDSYIRSNCDEQSTFYVVEKVFWDEWC